ncbi:serine carboxypeptidase-like 45 [Quercus lobata]|uniref:Carboxypeptidase n=1 Tax=Quercus lobata TaxID=97700 RepID=A0A7N2M4T9_QUELO|nr:serine carboxypeptidase-like 45 [Quercus lobata]
MIQSQQQWMVIAIICASLVQIFMAVESVPIDDKITSLPGQPQVSFQQFSGYITIDEKQERALFYYFVEAEAQPDSKPLVLWLNGGPGCSSIGAGAFVEHGPFKPSGDNLVKNEYSWNKEANILYLESPAGVGFSYSANKSFYNYVNDEIAARDSLTFLQRWFGNFPEYRDRDFFITGESYAGHYVPQLAYLIIQSKVKFNLKGIAIGNPLLEFAVDFNSPDQYYWSHGLISDGVYELLTKSCNSSQIMRGAIRGFLSSTCTSVYTELAKELTDFIDRYNVIGDVCLSSIQSQMDMLYQPLRSRFQYLTSFNSESDALSQQESIKEVDVCAQENTQKYLNRKDVQTALHAQLVGIKEWSLCSRVLEYDDENREIPTIGVVGSLVKSGIRSLVYSGDQDGIIPFTGTRTLVKGLAKDLGLNSTVPYRTWFEGKQVGGWTQVYGNNQLSFASIRGASHTAPATQPARSLLLFKAFLDGKPLPAEA